MAFRTNRINLDAAQAGSLAGEGPSRNRRSCLGCRLSNSNLIYAGIVGPGVPARPRRRFLDGEADPAAPLPSRWVWDIAVKLMTSGRVLVAVAGFGTGHARRAPWPRGEGAAWTDISGTAPSLVPDVPANSLQTDPLSPNYHQRGNRHRRLSNDERRTNWQLFSNGLEHAHDLRLHAPTRLLHCGHDRGLGRKLDVAALPNVDLYLRDHACRPRGSCRRPHRSPRHRGSATAGRAGRQPLVVDVRM
jgi:hypothetical protein